MCWYGLHIIARVWFFKYALPIQKTLNDLRSISEDFTIGIFTAQEAKCTLHTGQDDDVTAKFPDACVLLARTVSTRDDDRVIHRCFYEADRRSEPEER